MAIAAAVIQCVIISFIMAEGGFYFKDDGAIFAYFSVILIAFLFISIECFYNII